MIKILSVSALFSLLLPLAAAAQGLLSEPVQLFDGRVRIGGEISATFGAHARGVARQRS